MEYSYNGFPASRNASAIGVISIEPVPGRKFNVQRDVAPIFDHLIKRFHNEVERIDEGIFDDWSFAYRANRNSNNLSNHSSGTAVDLNATRHPNGKRNTFSGAQRNTINGILSFYEGLILWGDPGGPHGWSSASKPDEMHFEIANNNRALLNRILQKVGSSPAGNTPLTPSQEDDMALVPQNQWDALYGFVMNQERNPQAGWAYSKYAADRTDEIQKTLAEIGETLFLHKPDGSRWPGYGLDGINNNVASAVVLLRALSGTVEAPEVDVAELGKVIAEAIPANLAKEVSDELAKRLQA